MEFNDRRPGVGQQSLFGGEVQAPKKDLTKALSRIAPSDKPVGMRGSMADRATAPARLAKKQAAHSRIDSYRNRVDEEGDEDAAENSAPHPSTGMPSHGSLSTHDDIGMKEPSKEDAPPRDVTYHGSSPSARRKGGTVKEIAIQDANGPSIATQQYSISSGRMHEQMEHPETRSNPRLGRPEHPDVYEAKSGQHTVIDGNHRMAGALMRNEMFQPANVIKNKNRKVVQAQTKKIGRAQERARVNNPDPDRSDERARSIWLGSQF